MNYVEGYLMPVKTAQMEHYRVMATKMAAIWRRLGALSVVEARADHAPMGEVTSFPRAVLLEPDETVVFSYITYHDRAHRDAVVAAAMQDPVMAEAMQDLDIDGRRMVWGGFEVIVAA